MDKAAPGQTQCDLIRAGTVGQRPVIVVSNRGPVTFDLNADGVFEFRRGGGGLVSALIGLCGQAPALSWIACARTEADARWEEGRVSPDGDGCEVQVEFVTPDDASYEGYYRVIANPLLWFLQHSMWDVARAPVIDRSTWQAWKEGYVAVNEQFAAAVTRQVQALGKETLVMLQDYHLYLVPRLLRSQLPRRERPAVLHFVHIPWPGAEYWRILPPAMRQAILDGLCGADLVGFQTREDALNFVRTCESYLPRAQVNLGRGRVWYRNHATHVRDFPISIDVDVLRRTADSAEVCEAVSRIEAIAGDRQLILRVDRVEPSKNIVRGFQAYAELLEMYPQHRGRIVFLALLVPSRLSVPEYQEYLGELMAVAGQINARFGSAEWEPIRILVGNDFSRAVAAMKRYDVLLVNSLVDGMNLVAKEGPVVNECDGVLILSEGTGARQQLAPGATVISPYDVYATAEALHQALVMPAEERRARAQRLRWLIEGSDIADWLCDQLQAVSELNL